jgi:hypothetical protein
MYSNCDMEDLWNIITDVNIKKKILFNIQY